MGIFVDALDNGNVEQYYGNKDICTTYNLGNGNHKVTIEGNKTSVKCGNGNSQISVEGDECSVLTGDGDNTIMSVGSHNSIRAGNGNNTIVHYGNGGIINTGDGNQTISSVGDGKLLQTGSGNDNVFMLGSYNTANLGDGDNELVFYGNGCNIETGDGNDSITTFDQVKDNDAYSPYISYFESKLNDKIKEVDTITSKTVVGQHKKHHKFKKTSVWTTYYITGYTDYFNQKICGVKNTKINTGGGSDNLNVTVDKGTTKIKTSGGDDTVVKNKNYVYSEQYLGRKNWSYTTTNLSHHGHGKWAGGLGCSIIGTICFPVIGTVIGAYVGHDLVRG